MTIGVYTFELHLPASRSLKQKRQVLRSLKDRLRSRYNVAVTELGENANLWQRAGLAVVSIAGSRDPLERLFEAIYAECEQTVPGAIIEHTPEYLDATDGLVQDPFEEDR